MKVDYDVVVVGAGPGGSFTAKTLAEAGASVLLVEKRPEIGTPVRCGEATGRLGLELLELEPPKKAIAAETWGSWIYSPNGTKIDLSTDRVNGYILERKFFDKYLAILAAKAGAEVRARTYATGLISDNNSFEGVKLKFFEEEYEVSCRAIVGADGIEGKVGRWAGISNMAKLGQMIPNVQFEMAGVELENPEVLLFYFGKKVAPGGYAWVFPKGKDIANVGLGVRDPNKSTLTYLKKFIASKDYLRRASTIEINVGGVPVHGPLEKTVSKNVLLVGDAASQVNPLSGAGIYNAMYSGKVAGEVLAEAVKKGNFSEKFLSRYDKLWRKGIGKDLKRSVKIKNGLEKMTDEKLDSVAEAMKDVEFGNIDAKDISKALFHMPPEVILIIKALI